ncbi:bZIP transcription factor 2 [Cardamine amara subsp. amara]|uniref:BZIP transcription factor 2 n=1 Tax=Cardamine amara subsp. amara TaxID=228776 RepID=A0ABD1BH86_CARAN
MMSNVPAFSFAEPGLVNQLSDFQTGFTPWEFDCSDLFTAINLEPVVPSPCSGESETGSFKINAGSGSDESWIGSIKMNSGSNDSDCFHGVPSPQSDELDTDTTRIRINATNHNRMKLNRPVLQVTDDRKRKRMESNRESAKRSRMRKQRHIENLREEVNRLGLENRELVDRLRIVMYHIEQISTDNNMMLSEQEILRHRFSELRQILILRQLQQNPSLIINH